MDAKTKPTAGLIVLLLTALLFAGCAVAPPVQEMSDARQALKAAREAHADRLAPDLFQRAEHQLDTATHQLERGAYARARSSAINAKEEAIRARDLAIGGGGGM
jgi:PBP1b-binding outer membrane lipoprotein LpoB